MTVCSIVFYEKGLIERKKKLYTKTDYGLSQQGPLLGSSSLYWHNVKSILLAKCEINKALLNIFWQL